jgi:transposase
MPRPHTTMRKIRDVLRLRLADGLSLRQVARSLSMPHTTVADYARRATAAGLTSWPLPDGLDGDAELEARLFSTAKPVDTTRVEPDFALVQRELRRKGVTLALLWLEFAELHPDACSYSSFCRHYRTWKGRRDVTMRQDHKAGEKLFVDFPGMTIPIYDATTLEVSFNAELFVAVMGASSYLFAEAVRSQALAHWVEAHEHAFEFFGGTPAIVVPDNLRSAVTRSHRYEPDVNATYQEMAEHYGCVVIPARPYKPRDKAKVEAGVQLCERWIIARLRHQRFTSLGELNEVIGHLVAALNAKPFKKMDGSRASHFNEIDRPALGPLPQSRYDLATWTFAKVSIDYHVEVDRHFYSVPYALVGVVVDVRATSSVIEVFHKHRRVASHQRSYAARYVTDAAHMPSSHRRYAQWTPGRIIRWAATTGPSTAQLVEGLMTTRPHPEQGFRSAMGVMRLTKQYGPERLEAACARACAIESFSFKSVASILQHGLDQQPLAAPGPRRRTVTHANVRGPSYYQ